MILPIVRLTPKVYSYPAWQFVIEGMDSLAFYTSADTWIVNGFKVYLDDFGPFIYVPTDKGVVKARLTDWIVHNHGHNQVISNSVAKLHYDVS